MIIETITELRDKILSTQQYLAKGFADVQMVEYAERRGLFLVDSQGEFDFAATFDFNFFYIRRNGSISVSGNSQSGFTLQPRYRLFASAKDVDLYEMIKCLFSAIATYCSPYSITGIETEVERTLLTEMKDKELVTTLLSRFTTQKILAIDFSLVEMFFPFDVTTCECNPCIPCATK